MGSVKVERIDHLGIVAGVIQDLNIIDMIDSRITPDEREEITTGEAIAGMIINGLGFSDRPMSLIPILVRNETHIYCHSVAIQNKMQNLFFDI